MTLRDRSLALVTLLALASCGHTAALSTTADPGRRDALRKVMTLYHAGQIAKALALARRAPDNKSVQALVALTENHPSQALALTHNAGDDAVLLQLRAKAAWLTGDGAALKGAVDALTRLGKRDGRMAELGSMAALAAAAREQRLRQVSEVEGASAEARFDPRFGVPIVELKINGKPARFFWDTGAEMTVIDSRAADRLQIKRPAAASVTLHTNAGKVTTTLGLVAQLELLGLSVREVPVVLADLSALPAQLNVVGILGVQDLARSQVITVDYGKGRVVRGGPSSASGIPLYFVKATSIVAVEGAVQGGPPGLFRLDTGGRRSVLTKEYTAAALAKGAEWKVSAPAAVDVRAVGRARRQRRTLQRGKFCPGAGQPCIELTGVPVDTTAADSLIRYAGKLGADAFAGKLVTFDYPACRLRLSAAQSSVTDKASTGQ